MADRAKKISELTALTNASGDDLLVIVDDPAGAPETKKIALSSLFANVVSTTTFKSNVTSNSNLTIIGLTTANTLYVGGNSTFINTATFSSNVLVSGTLNITTNLNTTALSLANTTNTPASASATGVKGEVRVDSNYIYVCVATNTWKRASLGTW